MTTTHTTQTLAKPVGRITWTRAILAFLAVFVIASLQAPRAEAHGAGLPAHQIGAVNCSAGTVKVNPPRQMLSWYNVNLRNAEMVHWTPQLYRWNANQKVWQFVAGRPWFRAFTSIYGYYQQPFVGAWSNTVTNAGVLFVPFFNLPRGYYAIRNVMFWNATSTRHVQWSGYCYAG